MFRMRTVGRINGSFKSYRIIVRVQHYQNHKPSPKTCGSSAMHLQRKLVMAKDANAPLQKFSAVMLRTYCFRNFLIQEGMFLNYGESHIFNNFKDIFSYGVAAQSGPRHPRS
jgi:hypothetical protein